MGTMITGQTYTFTGHVRRGASVNALLGARVELTSDASLTPATSAIPCFYGCERRPQHQAPSSRRP
ncbi:hypothetical protein SBA3_3920008 [Candidatus Sulfopaludibacter sp. SbA3]|nr:hypothetical protein SBA3_3920008 [Candidatus Sulfopaludibacter sp. SbA3]